MTRFAQRTISATALGQDKVKVTQCSSCKVVGVLADGIEQVPGGQMATEVVVNTLSQSWPDDFASLFDSLLALDYQIKVDNAAGLANALCVYVNETDFIGAVVGSSEALLISSRMLKNLASEKEIQPVLGDGEAFPTVFSGSLKGAVLLLCSDGLSKYISVEAVIEICSRLDNPESIVDELLDAMVLPEGELKEDASVIVLAE